MRGGDAVQQWLDNGKHVQERPQALDNERRSFEVRSKMAAVTRQVDSLEHMYYVPSTSNRYCHLSNLSMVLMSCETASPGTLPFGLG